MNIEQDEVAFKQTEGPKILVFDTETAADYMQGPMRKLHGFEPSGDLWAVVIWEHTAQGTAYWFNTAEQL